MPTLAEIKLALGGMDKSSVKPSKELSNINENVNPFEGSAHPSEKIFAPIDRLESEIKDKDRIIEDLQSVT